MRKLTIDDIADLRAYERERDEFRARIIELKKRRRLHLGELMTIVFENTDTMRWQVQEMARAEKMLSDEQIQHEIETYNELIPEEGELSATLLVELTSEAQLREWLPKLVGIQDAISIWLDDGSRVAAQEPDVERLTREEEITTTVHYLKFRFTPQQAKQLASAPAQLVVDHPEYDAVVKLTDEQRSELAADLGV